MTEQQDAPPDSSPVKESTPTLPAHGVAQLWHLNSVGVGAAANFGLLLFLTFGMNELEWSIEGWVQILGLLPVVIVGVVLWRQGSRRTVGGIVLGLVLYFLSIPVLVSLGWG